MDRGLLVSGDVLSRISRARAVAREAGRIAVRLRQESRVRARGDADESALAGADLVVERYIRAEFGRAFPHDAVLGEEIGGARLDRSRYSWVIDPIDGTSNFRRHLPDWCVAIALLGGGRTLASLIYAPASRRLYWALDAGGAHCNGRALRVRHRASLSGSMVGVGFNDACSPAVQADIVGRLASAGCAYRRHGSGPLALACVADGRFDAYVEPRALAWDAIAGLLLVREAGGWARPERWPLVSHATADVVATVPAIRDSLLAALADRREFGVHDANSASPRTEPRPGVES